MPVSLRACCSHGKPFVPMPSKLPGLVRGFQMPARIISTLPVLCKRTAVSSTCSSVSALQGPAIINGRLFHVDCTNSFDVCVACISLSLVVSKVVFIFFHFLFFVDELLVVSLSNYTHRLLCHSLVRSELYSSCLNHDFILIHLIVLIHSNHFQIFKFHFSYLPHLHISTFFTLYNFIVFVSSAVKNPSPL